jgi:hypothetical protein
VYLEALAYHVNIVHGLGVDQVEVETEPLIKLALALTQHPVQFPKDLNERVGMGNGLHNSRRE